jgi:YVTN family beta-propeller protein
VATNTAGPPIHVGRAPYALAITPNGRTAFVADYRSNAVTPIDLATNIAGRPIPVGANPYGIAVTPDGAAPTSPARAATPSSRSPWPPIPRARPSRSAPTRRRSRSAGDASSRVRPDPGGCAGLSTPRARGAPPDRNAPRAPR